MQTPKWNIYLQKVKYILTIINTQCCNDLQEHTADYKVVYKTSRQTTEKEKHKDAKWERKQIWEELVTVCGHTASLQQRKRAAAARCLGANLSGDAVCYLERRVINEGRAEFGYGGGGRRMINLNELSCRLNINCRGCNVWLNRGLLPS